MATKMKDIKSKADVKKAMLEGKREAKSKKPESKKEEARETKRYEKAEEKGMAAVKKAKGKKK